MRATLCDGRYRVLRKLGEGGMAHVYLAHDDKLERAEVPLGRTDISLHHRKIGDAQGSERTGPRLFRCRAPAQGRKHRNDSSERQEGSVRQIVRTEGRMSLMSFFNRRTSAPVARERLQILLAHERAPDIAETLNEESPAVAANWPYQTGAVLAWLYLVVFGSLIAFNAYMPVMLAVMEIPGCLVALFLVSRLRHHGMDPLGNMPGEPGYNPDGFNPEAPASRHASANGASENGHGDGGSHGGAGEGREGQVPGPVGGVARDDTARASGA